MVKKIDYTNEQLNNCYYYTNQIIENLDELAINELTSGSEKDLNGLINVIIEESHAVVNLKKDFLDSSVPNYLTHFRNSIDESLKLLNLNYFVATSLPDFEINWHHIEWFNMIQMYQLLAIIAARGHSKSWSITMANTIWKLYRYKKRDPLIESELSYYKDGMIITNEFGLAKKILKDIKEIIEDNDSLRERIKPNKVEGWGAESLTSKNGGNIWLSSFDDKKKRGRHPDFIIVDDFLDKSCLYSKERREKFFEVFEAEIMKMGITKRHRTVNIVGTPFHDDDLYQKIKKMKQWKLFEYPAIFPDGSILWEEKFPFSAILEEKEKGNLIFSREMLVKPISDSSTIFPYSILEKAFINTQEIKLVENIHSFPIKFKKVVTGCDFALSANIAADYSVFTTWGIDTLEQYWLLNIWRKQGASYNEQIGVLQRINSNFKPSTIVMESNGFQAVMKDIAQQHGLRNAQEFQTTSWNKKDMYNGLPAMAVLFERGQIKLPTGDEYSRQMADMICSEFNSITFNDDSGKLESAGNHDDCAMSSFFGIKGINEINNELKISMI